MNCNLYYYYSCYFSPHFSVRQNPIDHCSSNRNSRWWRDHLSSPRTEIIFSSEEIIHSIIHIICQCFWLVWPLKSNCKTLYWVIHVHVFCLICSWWESTTRVPVKCQQQCRSTSRNTFYKMILIMINKTIQQIIWPGFYTYSGSFSL